MPQQIAFMVMPFGRKPTDAVERGAPTEVDFDALWHEVFEPVLDEAGYTPVRADADTGALVIEQMIQRLAVADLVVAEVSTPNANVYYEVGVRHAARTTGCVLVAADWARPVFDLSTVRQVRYPLGDGRVTDAGAGAARDAIRAGLEALVDGTSPVFEAVPGFPGDVDPQRLSAFTDLVAELSAFQGAVRAVAMAPAADRRELALDLVATYGERPALREAVVLELLRLLRDHVDFAAVLAYVDRLPERLRTHPLVAEQRYLAMAKTGEALAAAAHLEQMIDDLGPTSERLGLLGGRFKQLHRGAEDDRDRARYLDLAIDAYHRGMLSDLNDYYPSCNLPRLYRARGRDGDEQLAEQVATVAHVACERAIAAGTDDAWTRPTLLQAAVQAGDVVTVRRLVGEIERDGIAAWMLGTSAEDVREDIRQHPDEQVRAALSDELGALLDGAVAGP